MGNALTKQRRVNGHELDFKARAALTKYNVWGLLLALKFSMNSAVLNPPVHIPK